MECVIYVDRMRKRSVTCCGVMIMPKKYGRLVNLHCCLKSRRNGVSWMWLRTYRSATNLGLDKWRNLLPSAGVYGKIGTIFGWEAKVRLGGPFCGMPCTWWRNFGLQMKKKQSTRLNLYLWYCGNPQVKGTIK